MQLCTSIIHVRHDSFLIQSEGCQLDQAIPLHQQKCLKMVSGLAGQIFVCLKRVHNYNLKQVGIPPVSVIVTI